MKNSVLIEYEIGDSEWDALKKRDFILASEWMVSKCVPQYADTVFTRVEVEYETGSSVEYSFEEFRAGFSAMSEYHSVEISAQFPERIYLSCAFNQSKSARLIYVSGEPLQLPEIEDLGNELKDFIEGIYAGTYISEPTANQTSNVAFAGGLVPSKVEVSLSDSEHKLIEKRDIDSSKHDWKRLTFELVKDVLLVLLGFALNKLL